MKKIFKVIIFIFIIFLLICTLLYLIFKDNKTNGEYYTSLSQLDNTKLGVTSNSAFDEIIEDKLPNSTIQYYDNVNDRINALRTNKISAFITDEALAKEIVYKNEDLTYLDEFLTTESFAFAISPKLDELKEEVDNVIIELRENGTLEYLERKWLSEDEEVKELEDIKLSGENGTIKFGTLATSAPFAYMKNNEIVGYDIDTMLYICEALGYKLEIVTMDWTGLLTAVSVGKVDMAGCSIIVTEERKEKMLFSEPNFTGGVVAVVKQSEYSSGNFIENIKDNFYSTFIEEDRYKLFLQGITVTLEISISTIVLGTIIGCLFGRARLSKSKIIKNMMKLFISVIQGLPITLLLLIMYYIIFQKIDISPILVSIITFSIYLGVYVAEMIRGSMESINKNQILAAKSLGFSKFQTLRYIIFPQIIISIMPNYKGQIISTVKTTSIVGYISVLDLTKIGDIVRSRTFDAFFSLISVAIIYLIFCLVLEKVMNLIEKKVNKKGGRITC